MLFLRVKPTAGQEILLAASEIVTITGRGPTMSIVTLRNGTELVLSHSADGLISAMDATALPVK